MKVVKSLPSWFNAIIAFYQRSHWPGKYRFYQLTARLMRQTLIRHRVGKGSFAVPWSQWCFWLQNGPEHYYLDEFEPLAECINAEAGPVSLVDLGADIGIVGLTLVQRCPAIRQIVAVEPNPLAFEVLQQNMQQLLEDNTCVCKAVAAQTGTVNLAFDAGVMSDHEGHIRIDEPGDTQAVTLDELVECIDLHPVRVIKIDVEGQESAAFQGGHDTIAGGQKVILFLEIHPEVLERTHQTPETLFEAAESIRPFQWLVPRLGNQQVDRQRRFYEQCPYQQYDVIGVSE